MGPFTLKTIHIVNPLRLNLLFWSWRLSKLWRAEERIDQTGSHSPCRLPGSTVGVGVKSMLAQRVFFLLPLFLLFLGFLCSLTALLYIFVPMHLTAEFFPLSTYVLYRPLSTDPSPFHNPAVRQGPGNKLHVRPFISQWLWYFGFGLCMYWLVETF